MVASRSNKEWLQELSASGTTQETAIADLRDILLRAALYFFSRNLGDFGGLSREEILQLAQDCAQEALIKVLDHLSDFRGDSKFTTWAYKFAINTALMTARHERWKGVSFDELVESGVEAFSAWGGNDQFEATPEESALQGELRGIIRNVIERELTDKQRQVLMLMVFNEAPMDEVVRHLGTNRNAIYKMLHDARRKLKSGLQAHGFEIDESLALFAPQG